MDDLEKTLRRLTGRSAAVQQAMQLVDKNARIAALKAIMEQVTESPQVSVRIKSARRSKES